ncbi:MAG: hypothetical protein EBV29_04595 [Gammaproteobacteria bacterium]|nr:hypothetical protein [Gammaproteobacteria bacterium]
MRAIVEYRNSAAATDCGNLGQRQHQRRLRRDVIDHQQPCTWRQHRIATRRGVVDAHELIGIAAPRPGDAPCRDAHAGCGRLTDRCVIGVAPTVP